MTQLGNQHTNWLHTVNTNNEALQGRTRTLAERQGVQGHLRMMGNNRKHTFREGVDTCRIVGGRDWVGTRVFNSKFLHLVVVCASVGTGSECILLEDTNQLFIAADW